MPAGEQQHGAIGRGVGRLKTEHHLDGHACPSCKLSSTTRRARTSCRAREVGQPGKRVQCRSSHDRSQVRRDLEDGGASVEGEGHKFEPWGFAGGHAGFPAELVVRRADGGDASLPSKVPYTRARAGDRFIMVGPSGGGYGDPRRRASERVLRDVLDGYISVEMAARDYGVVITSDLAIDREATARTRATA